MQIGGYDIGVCSWSLRPDSTDDLVRKMRELDLSHLQLALGQQLKKAWGDPADVVKQIRDAGVIITAGMMSFPGENYASITRIRQTGGLVPDDTYAERREMMLESAKLAHSLQIDGVSTHLGFLPTSHQANYSQTLERIRDVATAMADIGVDLLMETGQETASALLQFLNDLNCRNVMVNFDPANMLLYGCGDPVEAVQVLGRHIGHVHIKDGNMSNQPGTEWGSEQPVGRGQVRWFEFLAALRNVGYVGPLVIECEMGDARMSNVRTAISTLQQLA